MLLLAGLAIAATLIYHGYKRHNAIFPFLWELAVFPTWLLMHPASVDSLSFIQAIIMFLYGVVINYVLYGIGWLARMLFAKKGAGVR